MSSFIQGLQPELRAHVSADESRLTYDTVARRTQELERSYFTAPQKPYLSDFAGLSLNNINGPNTNLLQHLLDSKPVNQINSSQQKLSESGI